MSRYQKLIKRLFDILASGFGLILFFIPGLLIAAIVVLSSKGPAIFTQKRVGQSGKLFSILKFRTMYKESEKKGFVTTHGDARITAEGRILRKFKLDELPQLWNVFIGKMSFVGPRPDVPGYADKLSGDARRILQLRPGITGPASIYFRHEELLLSSVNDPKEYNDVVIWPKKINLNLQYIDNWSFWKDIGYIFITLIPALNGVFKLNDSPIQPSQITPNNYRKTE